MSDNPLGRRDFLFGRFLRRAEDAPVAAKPAVKKEERGSETAEEKSDWGWKPDWQPATVEQLQEARANVRAQLGALRRPEEKPFDVLSFIAELDGKS